MVWKSTLCNTFLFWWLLGPYWTHILFTFTKRDGLKVYINGTFNTSDAAGSSVSEFYGDPYPDLVIGTGNDRAYGHYVTGAFDEFVIWEKALTPNEICLYYKAATGRRTALLTKKMFPVSCFLGHGVSVIVIPRKRLKGNFPSLSWIPLKDLMNNKKDMTVFYCQNKKVFRDLAHTISVTVQIVLPYKYL